MVILNLKFEVEINTPDFADLSLNLAMPREYLFPPVAECSDENVDESNRGDAATADGSGATTTVPLSSYIGSLIIF